jgi:hypothetical protein
MSKKQNSSIKVAAMSLGLTVEQTEELLDMKMLASVKENERRQISEMYKKLYEHNEKLEDSFKKLKECAVAFAFILPEPHKDASESITNTELYRVQHKMAKKQWLDWFNTNAQ